MKAPNIIITLTGDWIGGVESKCSTILQGTLENFIQNTLGNILTAIYISVIGRVINIIGKELGITIDLYLNLENIIFITIDIIEIDLFNLWAAKNIGYGIFCLLYTSPSPRD